MAMVAMATAAGSAAIVAAAVAMAGLTVVAGAVTAVMETATGRQNGNAGRRQQPDGISDSSNGNCSAVELPQPNVTVPLRPVDCQIIVTLSVIPVDCHIFW
jgi:hypothetical protein